MTLPPNPVHGNALCAWDIMAHHRLQIGAVNVDAINLVLLHIGKVDEVVDDVKVQGNNVLKALSNTAIALTLSGHLTQVVTVGEHQPGSDV